MTDAAPAAYCRNCSFQFGGKAMNYCPHCGQDTSPHAPSFLQFVHEFIGHYIALEGKLWPTLGLLFTQPGVLTLRYREGKKQRYILPLRLYLTASILFFLIVKLAGVGNTLQIDVPAETKQNIRTFATMERPDPAIPAVDAVKCPDDVPACRTVKSYMSEKYKNMTVGQMGEQVKRRILTFAPYAMFFLLPVFALLTKLMYRRRRLYYGEHMVFAFHVHAFAFFAMLLLALLPAGAGKFVAIIALGYFFIAMQRFFGGRIWVNAMRYTVLGITYQLLIFFTILAAFFIAVFL